MDTVKGKVTQYGFEWGGARVECLCSDDKKGWVVIGLETDKYPHHGIQIYVTKTGKVRIHSGSTEWLPVKKKKRG